MQSCHAIERGHAMPCALYLPPDTNANANASAITKVAGRTTTPRRRPCQTRGSGQPRQGRYRRGLDKEGKRERNKLKLTL